jgi:hypothetical protein
MFPTVEVTPQVFGQTCGIVPIILRASKDIFTANFSLQMGQLLLIKSTAHFSQKMFAQFLHSTALLAISRQTGQFRKSVGD